MNYFKNELEKLLENSSENSALSSLPDEIFWLDGVRKDKKKSFVLPIYYSAIVIISAVILMTVSVMIFGKGWLGNVIASKNGENKGFEFVLPLAERPALTGDENYQPDGRFTVQGVVNAVMDSTVSIVVYGQSDQGLLAGQGSGVIMSEDGFIVTNAHVVQGLKNTGIRVKLNNGEVYQGEIVGSDEVSDIAVVKINAKGLTPATFGDSSALSVGEQIVAIGCPGGLEGSVSTGIVSGLNREIHIDKVNLTDCVQVDAPINPGNSGGALVNMWGQVVGIVSAKLESKDYDGIGFAISSVRAKKVVEDLIEYGCVLGQVTIGIEFYQITDELSAESGQPKGLYITGLVEGCDISKSGLAVGDTITTMNGKEVCTIEDVDKITRDKRPGDVITFTYLHDGKTITSSFELMNKQNLRVNN